MTHETRKQWADELARCIYERDRFKKLASNMGKLAVNLRKQRDHLGALQASSRMREYRNTSAFYAEGVSKARAMLARQTKEAVDG